jgi:hypothetical protein
VEVPVKGVDDLRLDCAIYTNAIGRHLTAEDIHSSMEEKSYAVLNDSMFDALDAFQAGGGEAWVYKNL